MNYFEDNIYFNKGNKVNVLPEDDENVYLKSFSNNDLSVLKKLKYSFENGNNNSEILKKYKVKNEKYEDLEKYKNLLILRFAIDEKIITNVPNKIKYKIEMIRKYNLEKEFDKIKGFKLIEALAELSKYNDTINSKFISNNNDLVLELSIKEETYTDKKDIVIKQDNNFIYNNLDLDSIYYFINIAQEKELKQDKQDNVLNNEFNQEELEILEEHKLKI